MFNLDTVLNISIALLPNKFKHIKIHLFQLKKTQC